MTSLSGEHAEDVLGRLAEWLESGDRGALIVITATEGGAVRAPGAMLAVSDTETIGYISGGCIDADVALQARACIDTQQAKTIRYGSGSPFVDLPLPCGGAIEVMIVPNPDVHVLKAAHQQLRDRRRIELIVRTNGQIGLIHELERPTGDDLVFSYVPKLRLRIAGRGADALALAKMSDAAGYATHVQLVDDEDITTAHAAKLASVEKLATPSDLSANVDDQWTAFVLLFHDQDWEVPLLLQAVRGPAFYVGAVGSTRTHKARCDALKSAGCADTELARVKGPIGLVPSLRDASMLAVSIMAEIVAEFPDRSSSRLPRTAILMLAAGASSRFSDGDKLLADLSGRAVLEHTALNIPDDLNLLKLAVVSTDAPGRKLLLEALGWQTVENHLADEGQSTSIRVGIEALSTHPTIDQVIIILADMPFVPPEHLSSVLSSAEIPGAKCVMSNHNGVLSPPALFKREHFQMLGALSGDRGAKAAFVAIEHGNRTVDLAPSHAADIDITADLERALETTHA